MEAALSLGSNLGDRRGYLDRARRGIARLPETVITVVSSIYETEPVDVRACDCAAVFLNAVVVVDTRLDASVFSDAIHSLEDALGRRRGSERHAPRTLDIDIIYFGELLLNQPGLQLPHPAWAERRFVCLPLAEVRPDRVLPGQRLAVREILARLPVAPAVIRAAEQWPLSPVNG